mmetsp:Transcript_100548/g.280072  ORF Transcript_100548/g.280072 Transcript_100548/m.280072 type:complete len:203 (+) Transcript_100548:342-950(+)
MPPTSSDEVARPRHWSCRESSGNHVSSHVCTMDMMGRLPGSKLKHSKQHSRQHVSKVESPGHTSGNDVMCFPGASSDLKGSLPVTRKYASIPKEKTSAAGEGRGGKPRSVNSSGAIQAFVPPKGFAFFVISRASPKSSSLALGYKRISSTRILDGFKSPCTMGGVHACKCAMADAMSKHSFVGTTSSSWVKLTRTYLRNGVP